MQKLIVGVHKFQQEIFGRHRALFEELSRGQTPEVLFITCSDSRINPSLLLQSQPGDVFIVRNAGNLVPTYGHIGGEAASIEFAIKGLGIQDVIVCGHSHCGAMKALLHPPSTSELPAMCRWLEHAEITRQIVKQKYTDRNEEQLLNVTIQENVLAQLENLRTHPAIAAGLAAGRLRLHGWVYKIETGEVFAFEPAEGQFRPLQESNATRHVRTPGAAAAGDVSSVLQIGGR